MNHQVRIPINGESRFLVKIYQDDHVTMTVEDLCGCVNPTLDAEARSWYQGESGRVCRFCGGEEWTSSQDEGTMAPMHAVPGIIEALIGILDAKGIPHRFGAVEKTP